MLRKITFKHPENTSPLFHTSVFMTLGCFYSGCMLGGYSGCMLLDKEQGPIQEEGTTGIMVTAEHAANLCKGNLGENRAETEAQVSSGTRNYEGASCCRGSSRGGSKIQSRLFETFEKTAEH